MKLSALYYIISKIGFYFLGRIMKKKDEKELEPYIEKLMPKDEEIQNIDCTEILTDEIMQDIYENLIV